MRSCLLRCLHHHIAVSSLSSALDLLPLLARRGLRPPSQTLALLLSSLLRVRSLPLARRLLLYLRQSALLPRSPPLANHLISLHFLLGRPDLARQLFDKMPAPNVFSFNAMLAGYARLGALLHARQLFDRMPHRDVVSWNTMIFALARAGNAGEAVGFYSRLRRTSLGFNLHSFAGLLIACVGIGSGEVTSQAHAQVLVVGFGGNFVVGNSLMDAYCKCGRVGDARKVFEEMSVRDVVAWTTMVYGYVMCGDLVSARKLFDGMPERNPVSWTSLIGGYTRSGFPVEALSLFREMMREGVRPDQFTFSSCLCACAAVASLLHGKQIHARILRSYFSPNAIVLSSLIDMYAKCGNFVAGQWIFYSTDASRRDTVLWNTVISSVSQHSDGKEAFFLFDEMVRSGMKPDSNTFLILLTACSQSGLVDEGLQLFVSMRKVHGIVPEEDHYVCLVDLLGRAGRFEEALEWLSSTPFISSIEALSSLLGSCATYHNLQLGMVVAQRLIRLNPEYSSVYVQLSNFYAYVGRWKSVEKVRHLMEEKIIKKERAASRI